MNYHLDKPKMVEGHVNRMPFSDASTIGKYGSCNYGLLIYHEAVLYYIEF